ncbi:hypothetical protein BST81_20670 [Leptolyngbya sp. 'hensonii']|nr:hypothetical protein BST81_20670 [Leptolyngbya sp. 'hensonii']
MGFINWLRNQPEENSESSQLSLLEESKPVRSRVDGATVRKDFTRTIQDKGGDSRTQAHATERMTRRLFGCGTDELYEETEGRRGDRTTLPQDAQSAYIVGETAATHRLKATDIDGNKRERHQQIIDTVEDASEQVKGIFPWNW